MRTMTAILTIATILGTRPGGATEHPLDEAAQALSTGDLKRSVEMYGRANADEPTPAGWNNLGVAMERAGSLEEALAAYQKSMELSNEAKGIKMNYTRVHVRVLLQKMLPYAAAIFFGPLGAFLMVRLARFIVSVWLRIRRAMRVRMVRQTDLSHSVQCRGGDHQADGKVYPDTENVVIKADLLLPGGQDVYPLQLNLQLLRSDGEVRQTLPKTVEPVPAKVASISFTIEDLTEVLKSPGTWKVRLIIERTHKTLGEIELIVVGQSDLIADLEAVDVRLIAICGNSTAPDNVIFPDVEGVVPCAIIRCRQYHPAKFVGMKLRLDLVNVDDDEVESQSLPLELTSDGKMEFCSVSRPIANDPISKRTGSWEFRVFLETRLLARIPFVITTFEHALDSIKVERFDIGGKTASGQIQRIRELVDVLDIPVPYSSDNTQHLLSVTAHSLPCDPGWVR